MPPVKTVVVPIVAPPLRAKVIVAPSFDHIPAKSGKVLTIAPLVGHTIFAVHTLGVITKVLAPQI